MIREINMISAQGVRTYTQGNKMHFSEDVIDVIKIQSLNFTGDPFDYYCGFNKDGKMLFSINCLTPCEVIYI